MTTAASWLECPVCEYRFSVPPEYLEKSGKCPKCENVFVAADCQLPEKMPETNSSLPEIPEPMVLESVDASGEPNRSSDAPPPPKVNESRNEEINAGTKDGEVDYNQSYVAANKQRSDPNKVLLWVSASCILAILLLIGIPYIASMMVNGNEGDNSSVSANNVNETEPKAEAEKTEAKNRGQKGKGKAPKKKKVDMTVTRFTEDDLKSIWDKCCSSVVLISAKQGTKTTTSHGVVVSEDGKIAVSLSHIANADLVRVRFAVSEYGADERWENPVVASTILNSNPAFNLGIIKVDVATKPAKSRTRSLKKNDRGVVPVLNNKASKDFLRMTRLRPPVPFSDLDSNEQKAITDMNLNPANNDYFALHAARMNRGATGVPVFDENGELVGIHVSHNESTKTSFLVTTATISKVLNDPNARPVEIVSNEGPKADAGKSAGSKSNAPVVKATSFESAIQMMSQIEWKVTDQQGYEKAQAFAMQWSNVNEEHKTADFTRRNKIEELKKDLNSQLNKSLFWPGKAIRSTINQSAIEAFKKKDDGWFACVRILKPAGLARSVDDEPAILVELVETNEKALLVPGDVEGPFIQGTEWNVFGHNKTKTRLKTGADKCMVIHVAGVKRK